MCLSLISLFLLFRSGRSSKDYSSSNQKLLFTETCAGCVINSLGGGACTHLASTGEYPHRFPSARKVGRFWVGTIR